MSTAGWRVVERLERTNGTYFHLNVQALGGAGKSSVLVKARVLPGPPYFCESCISNSCLHCEYVASQDTHDTEAA